jgi:hypothetical protein
MRILSHNAPKRLVIYRKDVELITGRKTRTAQRILKAIKTSLGKPKNGFVTIKEFATFTGLCEEDILKRLLD